MPKAVSNLARPSGEARIEGPRRRGPRLFAGGLSCVLLCPVDDGVPQEAGAAGQTVKEGIIQTFPDPGQLHPSYLALSGCSCQIPRNTVSTGFAFRICLNLVLMRFENLLSFHSILHDTI